ncbi:MAG: Ig-like domain-containing protein [bacterium]
MKRIIGVVVLGMFLGKEVKAGSLTLTCDWKGATEQGSTTSVVAIVKNETTGSLSNVSCEIILPFDALLQGLTVDGSDKGTVSNYSLGTLTGYSSTTLTWHFKLYTLGVNAISIKATATGISQETKTGKKYCHLQGSLNKRVALIKYDAYEGPSIENALFDMGILYTPFSSYEVSRISPATYTSMIIYGNNSSVLDGAITSDTFLNAIKNYMKGGGNILLLGNAPEILDSAGITNNAFTLCHLRQSIVNHNGCPIYEIKVKIDNNGHPITEGYSTTDDGIQVNYGDDPWIAYMSSVDPSRGISVLGYLRYREQCAWRESTSFRTLGEIPYERGKAVFLSNALFSSNSPTDGLKTLFTRAIDYLIVLQAPSPILEHTPLSSPQAGNNYNIKVRILDPSYQKQSLKVYYRVGDGVWQSQEMSGTGVDFEYSTTISPNASAGSVVSYYIEAIDINNKRVTAPSMMPEVFSYKFTVVDLLVEKTIPANLSSLVSPASYIKLFFNKAINSATVGSQTIKVTLGTNTLVDGTYGYDNGVITFNPSVSLSLPSTVNLGEPFDVRVVLSGDNVYSLGFDIDSPLEIVNVSSKFSDALFLTSPDKKVVGLANINGTGVACVITLKANKPGAFSLSLKNLTLQDSGLNLLNAEAPEAEINVLPLSSTLQVLGSNYIENKNLTLKILLPQSAKVQVDVYNIVGQKVRSKEAYLSGSSIMSIDMDVSRGLYFYKVSAEYGDGEKESRLGRMVVK